MCDKILGNIVVGITFPLLILGALGHILVDCLREMCGLAQEILENGKE